MKPLFVILVTLFGSIANGESSSRAAEKCVIEICGSKNFLLNTRGVGDFLHQRPDDVKQVINRNRPLMEEIVDAETEYNLVKINQFNRLQNIFTPGSLSAAERAMIGLLAIRSFDFSDLNGSYLRNENGKDKIVRAKFFKKFSFLEAKKREWLADVIEAFMGSTLSSKANGIENQPFEFALKALNVKPEEVPVFARESIALASFIRGELGRHALEDREVEIFEKVAAGAELNSFGKKAFLSAIARTYRLQNLIEGDTRNLLARSPFSMADILELNKQRIVEFKFALTSTESLRNLRTEILNSCSNSIASSIVSAPTTEQNQYALQISNAVKLAAAAVAPRYLNGYLLVAAQDALKNTRFFLPMDRATVRTNIDQHLASVAKDARNLRNLLSLRDPKEDRSGLLLEMIHILESNKKEGAKAAVFPLLYGACEDIAPLRLTDGLLTNHGAISISWQSALWPAYGAGNMAHELGHVVAKVVDMKTDLFETVTCQQRQKAILYGAAASADNLEEDFADNFSLTVQKELNKTWPYVRNSGCLLQDVDAQKKDFSEEAFDLTEDFGEVHSSSIYRLLQQQVGRGGLPASCATLPELKGKAFGSCAK